MIISRTPLRMSFAGGGSDMPQFYRAHGGAVLSTAIDKFIFVTVNKKFDDGIRLSYSVTEEVDHASRIQHRLANAALQFTGVTGGVEVTTVADIPSRGTGLGSSSAFAVGLLNVLYAFQGRFASAEKLAAEACHLEIERLKEPIGKQDQYAAAHGGLSFYEFKPDDTVTVSPLLLLSGLRQELESRCMMFYTGVTRSASAILAKQANGLTSSADKIVGMKRIVELAYDLRTELQNGRLDAFGEILHEGWELKKTMADGISNPDIDAAYDAAMEAGAAGGKLLGAGAGGFMLFVAPLSSHAAIERALAPLRRIPFSFESSGSRIIFAA